MSSQSILPEQLIAALGVIGGCAAVFGDYIAADPLLSACHGLPPASEAARHVLEETGLGANARVRTHPVLVVGEAFGYGTGRESPARVLRAAGVRATVGASFARMSYRNAINNRMLPAACAALDRAGVADGDLVKIAPGAAAVRWKRRESRIAEMPNLLQRIVLADDLTTCGKTLRYVAP